MRDSRARAHDEACGEGTGEAAQEGCLPNREEGGKGGADGPAREVKLELEFKRYETYVEKIREVYRPKGLLAFTTAAREYVRML